MTDQSRRHRRRLQNPQQVQRRDVLRAGSVGLLGMSLPELLRAQTLAADRGLGSPVRKAKACIMLFMWGGPAHQDTWDLKPDAPDEVRGEFRPIETQVPGIQICEHFPLLAQRTQHLELTDIEGRPFVICPGNPIRDLMIS